MRHALFLPIFDALADPLTVARLAAQAEEAGWDGVFVWDHITFRSPVVEIADPWITLSAIASATQSVRIGPMVTPLPRRRPAVVARQTASLDRLSGGRLTLGVGIADDGAGELSGTGEELDARRRGSMLDEALEILQAAWSGEPVQHDGEHFRIDGISFRPRPVQPTVPVWVAVRSGNTRPLRRAARFEGVFPVGVDSPDALAEIVGAVQELRAVRELRAVQEVPADLPGLTEPYDVAIGGSPGTDPAPFAAAGATWWMESFSPYELSVDTVRGVLRDGPRR